MTSQPMSPTDQDTTITPREPVLLDLAFRNNRGGKCVFQVKLHFDGLAQLLNEGLASLGWRWRAPSGGLYLWLAAPGGLDTGMDSAFCRACVEGGVLFVPGDLCFGDDAPCNFLRLSFGVLRVDDLREAGRRFVAVARRFR